MDWHDMDPRLMDGLGLDMGYKAMPAGLEGELPDTSQTSGWGYLWNPDAGVVIGTVDNESGGCDAFAFTEFDVADLAGRAVDCSMPWVDLVQDYASSAAPFDPSAGLGDLPRTGWLRAWPLWGARPPEGATGLRAALADARAIAARECCAGAPAVDGAHAAWLSDCLQKWGGEGADAFVGWLMASPDAPEPPSALEALEAQGVFVPFTIDAQSVPDFLHFDEAVDDAGVARACESATGRPLKALLETWADAVADLTDGGGNPSDMVGRARVQGLEEALRALGSRREDLEAALAEEAARGPSEPGPSTASAEHATSTGLAAGGARYRLLETCGDYALLLSPYLDDPTPYVVASGYDPQTGGWSSGIYRSGLLEALGELHDTVYVDPKDPEVVSCVVWTREDVAEEFEDRAGRAPTDEEVDDVVARLGADLEDISTGRGWDVVIDAIDDVAADAPRLSAAQALAQRAGWPAHAVDGPRMGM